MAQTYTLTNPNVDKASSIAGVARRIANKSYSNASRYKVHIFKSYEQEFPAYPWDVIEDIMLYCNVASLPGYSFATQERRVYSAVRKYPYQPIYTDLTLVFMMSANLLEKIYFENWMQKIQNDKNKNFEFYDNYTASIEIIQYDLHNNDVYDVICMEAYPITMSDIPLSYNSSSVASQISVTFAYHHWLASLPASQFNYLDTVPTNITQLTNEPTPAVPSSTPGTPAGVPDIDRRLKPMTPAEGAAFDTALKRYRESLK